MSRSSESAVTGGPNAVVGGSNPLGRTKFAPFTNRKAVKWIVVVALFVAVALLVWTFIEKPWVSSRLYRIGWENDPPEQFPDSKGQPTGLAVELVREAARRSGIQLQWVQHGHDGSHFGAQGNHGVRCGSIAADVPAYPREG